MGKRKVEIKGSIKKKTEAYRLANLAMFKFHSAYAEKNIYKKSVALYRFAKRGGQRRTVSRK